MNIPPPDEVRRLVAQFAKVKETPRHLRTPVHKRAYNRAYWRLRRLVTRLAETGMSREELLERFPANEGLITRLTSLPADPCPGKPRGRRVPRVPRRPVLSLPEGLRYDAKRKELRRAAV